MGSTSTAAPTTQTPIVRLCAALIAGAVIVCYANALSGPFVFDDRTAIVDNASIRSFAGAVRQGRNLPTSGRPLVALSFAANYRAAGLDVRGYHLTNVAIHLCTALLLFGVARRTLLMSSVPDRYGGHAAVLGFAIALLWAVHPLNTEAVDYITQRTESLMALLFVSTLYASIRALDAGQRGWAIAAILSSALGMACKESMVVAPIVVVLYDWVFVFSPKPARMLSGGRRGLYAGLALTWLVLVALNMSAPRSGSAGFSSGVAPFTYVLNQSVMIVRYLRLTFWPVGLAANYGRPAALTLAQVWPFALVICGLLALTALMLIRRPPVGFLGAWMFLTLAPTSGIIPIATEVGAERRMYLPLMALVAGAVVCAYHLLVMKRRVSPSVGIVVLIAAAAPLAVLTFERNREYGSALTLAQTTLARWPSPVAHGMVGSELAALRRDAEAVDDLRAAADVDPRARYNLGITLFNLKDNDGAIRELEILVREHPLREEAPLARREMGSAYARQANWPEAVRQYRLALAMIPDDASTKEMLRSALVNDGNALGTAGRFADAIAAFQGALAVDPSSVIARRGLATARFDSGDIRGALADAQLAVAADPSNATAYDLIGRAYAVQGRYDEALLQLERAKRLDPDNPQIQDDVAAVLAARAGSNRRAPVK